MNEIGKAIKERRVQLGLNQQTLADLSEVGINTVVSIEKGKGNPSLKTLLKIVNTLGLRVSIL